MASRGTRIMRLEDFLSSIHRTSEFHQKSYSSACVCRGCFSFTFSHTWTEANHIPSFSLSSSTQCRLKQHRWTVALMNTTSLNALKSYALEWRERSTDRNEMRVCFWLTIKWYFFFACLFICCSHSTRARQSTKYKMRQLPDTIHASCAHTFVPPHSHWRPVEEIANVHARLRAKTRDTDRNRCRRWLLLLLPWLLVK